MGPEYKRARMLRAAELSRSIGLSSPREVALSYWVEERRHVFELLNRDTGKSARMELTSALDVPTYAEVIETVLLRCRV